MSGLTKDQLKNELITHGVELPSSSAKKDEYLRLYEKYVAPLEQTKGDFSSDDEDSPIVPIENKVNMDQSLVVDGLDVATLDDEELFSRLRDLGATVGPIVDTTRKVYQKKLVVLMGGDVVDSPTYNGDVDEEEYSDSEEVKEIEVEPPVQTRNAVQVETSTTSFSTTSSSTRSPSPSEVTDIRKRILLSSGEQPKDDIVFDPDRHTPSPRRSLRSVTSTSTSSETITVRKHVHNGRRNDDEPFSSFREDDGLLSRRHTHLADPVAAPQLHQLRREKMNADEPFSSFREDDRLLSRHRTHLADPVAAPQLHQLKREKIGVINTSIEEEEEQDKSSKISLIVRLLVKLLILALIIALILYIYQNDPSESPFKAVEQLARQALEAAVGEETEVKDGDPIEPPVNLPPVTPSAPEAVPAH